MFTVKLAPASLADETGGPPPAVAVVPDVEPHLRSCASLPLPRFRAAVDTLRPYPQATPRRPMRRWMSARGGERGLGGGGGGAPDDGRGGGGGGVGAHGRGPALGAA